MAHPLDYPVYLRRIGNRKKHMIAKFRDLNDARRWALVKSHDYAHDADLVISVLSCGRVNSKFRGGRLVWDRADKRQ